MYFRKISISQRKNDTGQTSLKMNFKCMVLKGTSLRLLLENGYKIKYVCLISQVFETGLFKNFRPTVIQICVCVK